MKILKKIKIYLTCKIFFHDLTVIKDYGYNSQKLQCKRCKKYFGINHEVKAFLPWDAELEKHMDYLEELKK